MRAIAIAFLFLIMLCGCSKDPVAERKLEGVRKWRAALASGWKEVPCYSLQIAFPTDWKAFDLTSLTLDADLKKGLGSDPKYDQVRSIISQQSHDGLMTGLDTTTLFEGNMASTFMLTQTGAPGDMTPEKAARESEQKFADTRAPGEAMQVETATLNVGQSATLSSEVKNGGYPMFARSYYLVHGGILYGFHFTAASDYKEKLKKDAGEIMDTVRFLD